MNDKELAEAYRQKYETQCAGSWSDKQLIASLRRDESNALGRINRMEVLLARAATLLACESGFDAKTADGLIAEIRDEIGDFDDDPESPYDTDGNLIRGDFEEDDED